MIFHLRFTVLIRLISFLGCDSNRVSPSERSSNTGIFTWVRLLAYYGQVVSFTVKALAYIYRDLAFAKRGMSVVYFESKVPSINLAASPICASSTDLNSCAISSRCTSSPTQRSFSIGCAPLVMMDTRKVMLRTLNPS